MKVKVITDSRLLMIVLLFLIMQAMDKAKLIEMMRSSSCVVRKVTHSLSKDSLDTIFIYLRGIASFPHANSAANHCVHQLVDPICIGKLIKLYQNEEDKVQSCVHSFLLELSHLSSIIIYHQSIIYHLSSIIYHLSFLIYHLSSIIYHHLSFLIYHLSFIIYHLSSIIYHFSSIIYLSSIIIYHFPSIIYHL